MNAPDLWFGKMYEEDKYAKLRLKRYARLLSDYLKDGTRVLDIGCYTADLKDLLPPMIDYYGIDFDDGALEVARKKGARAYKILFDDEEIQLDGKFNIIICAEVLEHLKDPHKMMGQIKHLLKEDGLVLISLPNECTFYHRIMCLLGKGVDLCAFELFKHLHLPTIKQSEEFVKGYFRIIKKDYYINPGGRRSRWERLGILTSKIPDWFWNGLARLSPALFARGVIFLCTPKMV